MSEVRRYSKNIGGIFQGEEKFISVVASSDYDALAARLAERETEIQQRDQAEQQVARLRECSNNLVAFLIQNHEDVGIELYGRVNGTVPTPSATRLNELLASIQHALRETGA